MRRRTARAPYKIACSDDTGQMMLVFFHARPDYLAKLLPEGETRVISGTIEEFNREIQMTHPDHVGTLAELDSVRMVEPVYPLSTGLSLKVLRKAIGEAFERVPELGEWLDPAYRAARGWSGWAESLKAAHHPEEETALDPGHPARARLAYDELLANQLALALVRRNARRLPGREIRGDGSLVRTGTRRPALRPDRFAEPLGR